MAAHSLSEGAGEPSSHWPSGANASSFELFERARYRERILAHRELTKTGEMTFYMSSDYKFHVSHPRVGLRCSDYENLACGLYLLG
jgi:hypothetical protein